jgi:lipid-A-disaccharide synthase
MTIYFVAGEASADNHGAALMRALRQFDVDLRFIGRGGPQMKAVAGAQFNDWIDKSGVLGLWEVIKQYGYFRQQFRETLSEIAQSKPDAVVLIDYPGFNLRLAEALHRQKTAGKIIYYISPQVWAWNRGRIKKMTPWIDLMLCIFPFEPELYGNAGLRAKFVGHPMIDRLRAQTIGIERDANLVGLFPGSRMREVRKILPILMATAKTLRQLKPNLRFEVSGASQELANAIEKSIRLHLNPLPEGEEDAKRQVRVTRDTAGLMQRARVGIVASGSATLEAAYFRLPFVLIYKVAWPTYLAARLVVAVKYLGMPNVLANREVVPEFIQHQARSRPIAEAVLRLLNDKTARDQMISEFDAVIASLGEGGASERAARAILDELA